MDSLFEIDQLQLYFGDPYVINNNITIFQPTVGEIMKYGEKLQKMGFRGRNRFMGSSKHGKDPLTMGGETPKLCIKQRRCGQK